MAIRFIHQGKHYKKVELMGADNRKAIFTGCVRDCQPYLEKVLKNIDRISDCFSESAYIFVENDSTDGSKKILQQWASGKQGATIVNLDGLDKVPARTARLEFARNTFVEIIRSRPQLHTYDYMIVLDMDDINAA